MTKKRDRQDRIDDAAYYAMYKSRTGDSYGRILTACNRYRLYTEDDFHAVAYEVGKMEQRRALFAKEEHEKRKKAAIESIQARWNAGIDYFV